MQAYDVMYLQDARKNLANCLDYVVNDQFIDGEYFMMAFTNSESCKLFEKGNPSIISGISGVELAHDVLYQNMCIRSFNKRNLYIEKSKEYWLGYFLAEYQWNRNCTYEKIIRCIGYKHLISMYNVYHEMDEEQFNVELDRLIGLYKLDSDSTSHLQEIRKFNKLSQSELAKLSGVNIRTIREYEQKEDAILRGSYITLLKLSKALYCDIEDFMPDAPTFVR